MKKFLLTIVLWTWCIPQSILGLFVYIYVLLKDKSVVQSRFDTGSLLIRAKKALGGSGVSLGFFIFSFDFKEAYQEAGLQADPVWLQKKQHDIDFHEWGHSLQGFLLGPLYLLVIGLPSIIWAGCFEGYRKRNKKSYYWFYTEKWANKWAGLELY